ncbi:T9SS type A sorting domain-containing protein [Hymenobacter ruricola]|uniref:T9SS type A sorting domain-containing protein n=1 Tax=Hymenobacter ruricola TaxID=2791023 RepID=A0ABS0IBE0_9BACT|nr:T9SS type A sorting domain-containing protein [Hymenobacter ruricola]MBF9223892.1 T9SS type A sorting domain-containing protein [Hymenobacter ruricola]
MKHLQKFLLLAGLLLGWGGSASAQLIEWAKLARNEGNNAGFEAGGAVDAAGNSYVGFVFKDSARIGNQRLRAVNGTQAIIKYDSTGQVRWVKQLANTFLDRHALALDPTTGGVFVTGRFSNAPRWGTTAVAGGGNRNFYGKIAPLTGDLQWVNSLPLQLNVETSMAADGLGNFYFLSAIDSVVTIGGTRLDTANMFMVGARSDGTGQWVRPVRGVPAGGSLGSNGRPYSGIYSNSRLVGRPRGGCMWFGTSIISVYYGPGSTPALSTTNPGNVLSFLLWVGPTGTLVSARTSLTAAVPVPNSYNAMAVDTAGNYYVTGNVGGNIGIGVAKYDPAGNLVWATNQEPSVGGFPGSTGEEILVHPNGEVTIQAYTALIAGRSPTTIGTLVLRSENNLVHYAANGAPMWAVGDGTGQLPYNPRDGAFSDGVAFGADGKGNLYWLLYASTSSITGPGGFSLTPPASRLGAFTLVGAGALVTRVGTHHNTIRGALYLDNNGNGVRDSGDVAFPQTQVLEATQGTLSYFSSIESTGDYSVFAGTGAYTLAPPVPPLHYTISQPTASGYSGSFSGYGRADTARHFGFSPVANQGDLRVTFTPYAAARPGFVTRYRVTLANVGTTTVASGSLNVALDSRMSYISSTPGGSRTGQTVTWAYTNLAPFSRREFDVLFSLPTNTPLGTALSTTATAPLTGDVVPADNTATTQQTVTGSFDPNDITVNYDRLTPAQVAARQPLDYTVRFQNMGTDTAFTVVINDTLDFHKLNLSSLMLVAQSHNCIWSLSNAGLLTVRFVNIKLPHRNQDVIRSQGFVRFRVQPKPSLAVGEVIPNHASIVFDYNAPVITNTATTAVMLASATLARHDAAAWNAYPNPATDAVTIGADLATGGQVQLDLLDALGRTVRHQAFTAPAGALRQALDLSGLAPGLYVLRLTPPTGPASTQQLVRE